MSYSQTYRTLFELQVLHEYYLNSGPDPFRGMDPQQQQLMFKNYAFNGFLQVTPTAQTRKVMENQKLLLNAGKRGLEVIALVEETAPGTPAKPFIPLSDNVELHFLVKINDPAFEIYTDLTLVKNEFFFFSNIQPPGETNFPYLPTAQEQVDSPTYISDSYRLTPLAKSQEVADMLNISREDRIGLLGVVVLRMHGATHSITDNDGKVPASPTSFVMEFANRSTIWKYYFQNSDYYAETTSPKPLTRNGYNLINPQHLTLRNKDPELPSEHYVFDLTPYYFPAPDVQKAEIKAGIFYSVIYI
ncbi:hypothetical protein [Fluviicola sp.]|uniref:hypothetical protein n=1 Tax=Fluviicola sp. TaxID=1917219 RepID=UPI00261A0D27|nr:hypothetical protein [Fluviicola sp.]